jgi:hypothetical protein
MGTRSPPPAVLGAERGGYCAAVDASRGAESWDEAPTLRSIMLRAVQHSRIPIFFFQAENDYNLASSRTRREWPSAWPVPTESRPGYHRIFYRIKILQAALRETLLRSQQRRDVRVELSPQVNARSRPA